MILKRENKNNGTKTQTLVHGKAKKTAAQPKLTQKQNRSDKKRKQAWKPTAWRDRHGGSTNTLLFDSAKDCKPLPILRVARNDVLLALGHGVAEMLSQQSNGLK